MLNKLILQIFRHSLQFRVPKSRSSKRPFYYPSRKIWKFIAVLRRRLTRLSNRHFLVLDIAIFALTPLLSLYIRLDGNIDLGLYQTGLIGATIIFLFIKLALLYTSGFYQKCWRYASIDEVQQITSLMIATGILQTLAVMTIQLLPNSPLQAVPQSLPLLDAILSFLLIGGCRFSVPLIEHISQKCRSFYHRDRTLIIGAGSAGVALVKQMQQDPSFGLYPVAFIDDNPAKLNLRMRGIPVVGNRDAILKCVQDLHIHKIIIAIPSIPGNVLQEILYICQKTGIQTRTLPGMHEILDGRVYLGGVRDVQIEDLLRREPIQMDTQRVAELVGGKRVLVTGAGGSIGSELCRQILKHCPSELVLVGHGENSIFYIQQELEKTVQAIAGDTNLNTPVPRIIAVIADIRSGSRLQTVFNQLRPDIIFHAAAHKHVPMMELNCSEAITNNVLGTKNLLDLALQHNVKHFVMVSTDKAVNPTNIMGASKRVAEMLVLQAAQTSGNPYVVVRFGNVLGSRGSVIPTFKRQIAEGGPVTVTHPDICRYFMTIPEAVQLLLQAAGMGHGGEVFMLDMGQPVKIVDLAKELIRLSGYELGKTMDIVFTGLRPGEKLFEELFVAGEQYEATQHEKLFIVTNASKIIPANLNSMVAALAHAAMQNSTYDIVAWLKKLVPNYKSQYINRLLDTETLKEDLILTRSVTAPDKEIGDFFQKSHDKAAPV